MRKKLGCLVNSIVLTEVVASISSGGTRGQREGPECAPPCGVCSRPLHRGVTGRGTRGAWCPCARVVTGNATTAGVTHAVRLGSRGAAGCGAPPVPDAGSDGRSGGAVM